MARTNTPKGTNRHATKPRRKAPAAQVPVPMKKAATKAARATASAGKAKPAKKRASAATKTTRNSNARKAKPAAREKAVAPPTTAAIPRVEVVIEGQRYIVGEYGSVMSVDEFERFIARPKQS